MNKTIKLGNKVVVSDPCYSLGTWCQKVLENVKPGEYNVYVKKISSWGERNALLAVVHKDYSNKRIHLNWELWESVNLCVDSGQLGIFDFDTFRNDSLFNTPSKIFSDRDFHLPETSGNNWYGHMCDRTIDNERFGTYDNGVVSSSGFGDGSYPLYTAEITSTDDKQEIVGIFVEFISQSDEDDSDPDFEFLREELTN